MNRAYYADSIANFLSKPAEQIIGTLSMSSGFAVEQTQIDAWASQIKILNSVLSCYSGSIYFEFSIPRMGRRIDAVLLIGPVIFVLEFKIGAKDFLSNAIDQVCDYALDLKNFHEPSHNSFVAPLLIATGAHSDTINVAITPKNDKLFFPIKTNSKMLGEVLETVLKFADGAAIEQERWERGSYSPTPTIVEAAMALYAGHSVDAI
jgi:hypothetical protein